LSRVELPAPATIAIMKAELCGTDQSPRPALKLLVEKAAAELEGSVAHAWCLELLPYLTANPDDALALESLLVLGLAHPDVHSRHRISMPQEGRRFAILLERAGNPQRAEDMLRLLLDMFPTSETLKSELEALERRDGSMGRRVERHLRSAEEALREGRRGEAQRWLREVLALEPRRRDVARMIRDLRFEDELAREGWKRRVRLAALACVAVVALSVALWRERSIDAEYAALPSAAADDLLATRERLAGLDVLIDGNMFWLGMWGAARERSLLRVQEERLELREVAEAQRRSETRSRAALLADAERSQAFVAADRMDFDVALARFKGALEVAPEGWEHRDSTQREVALLEQWRSARAATEGEKR
jgi:tetratricopeptide (TPR) repeat protein